MMAQGYRNDGKSVFARPWAIDIVARPENLIVLIEVKTPSLDAAGRGGTHEHSSTALSDDA